MKKNVSELSIFIMIAILFIVPVILVGIFGETPPRESGVFVTSYKPPPRAPDTRLSWFDFMKVMQDSKGSEYDRTPVVHEEFTDFPIILGEGTDFPLKGILSIPNEAPGKVPAVVLVHGDGRFNMDEEIFTNKPFRDIAEYLAAHGVAVIRYDKRNYEHWSEMRRMFGGGITSKDTVIEDAILASEFIKSDPRIDEYKVFIIGHSKGGCLAPRIHAEGGDFAGIISMAGTPRSMISFAHTKDYEEIALMPEGKKKETALENLDIKIEEFRAKIMDMPEDEAKENYWGEFSYYLIQDYDNHLAHIYTDDISVPILILQGSADFTISADTDFLAWKELLAGRDNATFKLFEGLNHFFMTSAGYGHDEQAKENSNPGHVDKQVLAYIVVWILSV